MQNGLLIGLGAGIASAVLYASAWTGTALGMFVLFFLSPFPIAIASLGWGWAAGGIASATAFIALLLTGGPRTGFVYLVTLALPVVAFAYLALLNRQLVDENGNVVAAEWYPIGRIIAWATLWAGLVAAAAMLNLGSDAGAIRAAVLNLLERTLFQSGPGAPVTTPEQRAGVAALVTAFLPWAMATTWFTVAIINLWLAARVIQRSGRLTRPWPNLSEITVPPGMALAFGAAVLGSLAGDMLGVIASGFASACVFAFMLVGLGLLHRLTRNSSLRTVILGFVYAGLVVLPPFSNLIVALVGLAEPFLRRRVPPAVPPTAPPEA